MQLSVHVYIIKTANTTLRCHFKHAPAFYQEDLYHSVTYSTSNLRTSRFRKAIQFRMSLDIATQQY